MHKHAVTTLVLLVAILVSACGSAPTLTMSSTKELVYQEVQRYARGEDVSEWLASE